MEATRILIALSLVGGALGWALPPLSAGALSGSRALPSSRLFGTRGGHGAALPGCSPASWQKAARLAHRSRTGGISMSASDDMEAFVLELQVRLAPGAAAGCRRPDPCRAALTLRGAQAGICAEAEAADGKGKFIVDKWDRGEGKGYGITRVLEGGNLWEKAACRHPAPRRRAWPSWRLATA